METRHRIARRIAMKMPRIVAYWCFIRVFCVIQGNRVGDDFNGVAAHGFEDWKQEVERNTGWVKR